MSNNCTNKTGKLRTVQCNIWRIRATTVVVAKQEVLHIMGVSQALITQRAMLMRHIVICDLPSSKIFFHIISQTARLLTKIY